jgi:hypothetical protein
VASSSSSSSFALRMPPRSFDSLSMTPSRSLDSRAGPSHDVGACTRYSTGEQSEKEEKERGGGRDKCNPNAFTTWAVQSFSTGWAGGAAVAPSEPSLCSADADSADF